MSYSVQTPPIRHSARLVNLRNRVNRVNLFVNPTAPGLFSPVRLSTDAAHVDSAHADVDHVVADASNVDTDGDQKVRRIRLTDAPLRVCPGLSRSVLFSPRYSTARSIAVSTSDTGGTTTATTTTEPRSLLQSGPSNETSNTGGGRTPREMIDLTHLLTNERLR